MPIMPCRSQREWEVRHGGALGLKYLLASQPASAARLLPSALGCLEACLAATDGDVVAAAADALLAVAHALVAMPGKASYHLACLLC